jgi:hypothetical protein
MKLKIYDANNPNEKPYNFTESGDSLSVIFTLNKLNVNTDLKRKKS